MEINNIHYLKISINNKENPIDNFYLNLDYDKNINEYIKATKEIKEILITIKNLKNNQINVDDKLYLRIQKLLYNYGNKSEFACFITACDCNIEVFKTNKNIDLLKQIINKYIENRNISDITDKEWIQALLDTASSRKKGSSGQNKLISICKKFGYSFVNKMEDFKNKNKCIANLTTQGDFSINNIREKLGINLDFNNQEKILDVIIKNNNHYFCIEAKHLKTSGGEQNKQIDELIKIISKNNQNNTNIHFIAFLDGVYSNKLLNDKMFNLNNEKKLNKLELQQIDIIKNLNNNKSNLWLNTIGFIELLNDLNKHNYIL